MDGVIIVSGVPGAGKSTIAERLAAHFERAVHIEADGLQRMIVSGARWPGQDPHEEGFRQLRLRGRNCCLLADSFREEGFLPIVDDIVIGSRLEEFLADLQTRPIRMVMLLPDLATLRARNAQREKADAFHQSKALENVARSETKPCGLRIDSSGLTPEATVAAILRGLERDALIA